jgi:hypothetical protein
MKNDHFLKIEPCHRFSKNDHFRVHFRVPFLVARFRISKVRSDRDSHHHHVDYATKDEDGSHIQITAQRQACPKTIIEARRGRSYHDQLRG